MTLIEVLVVIGLIGLLMGLTLPALRGARGSAQQLQSVVNLKSLGVTMEIYTSVHASRYPYYRESGEGVIVAPPVAGVEPLRCGFSPHWYLEGMWPVLMHDVAPWPEHFATWLSPGIQRQSLWPMACGDAPDSASDGGWPSYRYSNSFIAAPIVWSGDPGVSEDDIRAVSTFEVVHPSKKVLMYDADRAYLASPPTPRTPRPVLLADSSASVRLDADATPPVANPLHWRSPRIYHDTPRGVAGRDY